MKYLLMSLLTLFILVGCGSRNNHYIVVKRRPVAIAQPIAKAIPHTTKKHHTIKKLPSPPKKKIKLKKIEDNNYNDNYMYPEDTKAAKKDSTEKQVHTPLTNSGMTREECIAMISQEKFDKYTAMFGSEAASIKRCTMLKAMNK
jgi:hypothetical protein